jgi:phospholipid/cholesterol/gamma-HCH transport system substrate-binding protein
VNARSLATGALCLAALVVGGLVIFGGSDDGYIVRAEFEDAGGVRKNSDVKVGEVPAGTVTKIDLGKGDRAIVTMKLDDGVGPIGAGAAAHSRPVNLLGEKFVDLDPGDLKRPVPSGSTIARSDTDTAVELDEILNTLQPGTRARLRILVNEAGIAMAGRGADFNRLLAELPGGLDESAKFLDAMSRDTTRLERLVVTGDRVLSTISRRREDLGRFVESADDALAVTASRRAALNRTLAAAPGGLGELRRTLGQLERAGDDLRPAAANLRTTAGPLASTLRQLPSFANDARQTLTAATEVAPTLNRLGTQGTATVRRLRPTLENFATFTTELKPISKALGDRAMKNLLRFMNNWGSLTKLKDGLGHIFRVRLVFGPDTLTSDKPQSLLPTRATKRKAAAPRPQAAPKAPDAPAAKPKLPELKLPNLPRIPDVPKLVGEAPKKILDGVAGGLLNQDRQSRQGQDDPQDALRLFDYLFGN